MVTNLENFLKFPLRDPDWVKKILIGCIISLIPVLNILTLGYFMECIRMGFKGRQRLPDWEDWSSLFQQGLYALVITIIYILIPLIVLALPGVGAFLSSLVFVIAGIMVPMALANYSIQHDYMAAFRFKEIVYQISKVINYYIVAYFAVALIFAIGAAIIISIPIIAFLGSALIFYSGLIYFNMVGQLYNLALYG